MNEEKFIRSEKYYKTILNNIKEHIIHVDTNGKILFANHLTELITHKSEDEVMGTFLQNYMITPKKTDFVELLKYIVSENQTQQTEIAYQYPDSSIKWFETVLTPLNDKEVTGIILLSRDITEVKSREETLKERKEKLEKASNTIAEAFKEMSK